MMDGWLSQPTRPALSLDSTFVQRAFGSGRPDGHISVAYTEVDTIKPQLLDINIINYYVDFPGYR